MDPRQPPQHPFSRSTASPYGRAPFPPSANPPPFPPSSHAPNAPPTYTEHQRRPSGPPYYPEQRGYAQDGAQMPASSTGQGHSRHPSSSSIGHGTPVNRSMPPPSSPQQQTSQQAPHHPYGPPPPRPPPVSVGPPAAFPSGRELPSLASLAGRASSTNMSISSMLGESRGPPPPPPSQYTSPITTNAPPPSGMYAGTTHASPRVNSSRPDYPPFSRRPQTPEHPRPYDPHDRRANSAGSPPSAAALTPEMRRWGTPQTYGQRPPPERGLPPVEERREPIRVANPNVPPRPSSQPTAFNPPPSRIPDSVRPPGQNEVPFGRREEQMPRADQGRQEPPYQRPSTFSNSDNPVYAYAERERQEREAQMRREQDRERAREQEREQRDRAIFEHRLRQQQEHEIQLAQRNSQNAQSRAPESRDPPAWMRPDYAPRPAYDQAPEQRPTPSQPGSSNYDHPRSSAPPYSSHAAYAWTDPRYPPTSQPSSQPQQRAPGPAPAPAPISHHETVLQERLERQRSINEQQRHQEEMMYGRPSQRPQYLSHESPNRRPQEEPPSTQQRFLGIQELNRKGRVSPLPQAVQGAQAQIGTPGGEPGIKSEFGRMFSGIGSGVGGGLSTSSPAPNGPSNLPFTSVAQLRKEDLEASEAQDSPIENGSHPIARTASQGDRRRKLKDEDARGDDDSTGRQTPSGNGKRQKRHHRYKPKHSDLRTLLTSTSHHHHRLEEQASSPSQSSLTPFKSIKGASGFPSPPGESKAPPNLHHHHVQVRHHHPSQAKAPAPPVNTIEPLPKTKIRSNAVLDSVSHLPRRHLGHEYYQPVLKPGKFSRSDNPNRGFASTPTPLPRFDGNENCTFTIRVARIHLSSVSREEITARRAVWGTDVYTDDSDVVAACIHQGWFLGEWAEDIDKSLLNLEIGKPRNAGERIVYPDTLEEPPARGPMPVRQNRDLHVTVLILPALEKYSSLTRFGMKSREWGHKHDGYTGIHDGLSFMIQKISWVDGVDSYEERNEGKKMKLRPNVNIEDMEAEYEASQRTDGNEDGDLVESFERGGPGPLDPDLGTIKAAGRNWWKKSKDKSKGTTTEKRVSIQKPLSDAADEGKEKAKETEQATTAPVSPPQQTNGGAVRSGSGSETSQTARSTPKPLKERLSDMFKREDF
ncbi:hypothetical protein BP5796_06558 [Coleophoma crateriformis]|uniref:Rxt3-domain-containing protein n=1 Tax=Coleophoma crateriformis TaxID=565419 RepID=A0A3D8RNU7_9HELO|nr:hypothetical protein BP5796_06558 [Coleophoma crateriformis]